MKYVITATALLVCSPVSATPTPLHSCDIAVWETAEVAKQCAQRAGNAAASTANKFENAGGASYRIDPIGAHIAAAKPVRSVKPKSATALAVVKPVVAKSVHKRPAVADVFGARFMASL